MFQVVRPIPEPGTEIERYEYQPLSPVPANAKRPLWFESSGASVRRACKAAAAGGGCERERRQQQQRAASPSPSPTTTSAPAPGSDETEVTPGSDPWAAP